MINLISFIRPFSIEQKIFIRDSAVPDKINIVSTNLSKYPETIFELIEQYKEEQPDLTLYGPVNYCDKLRQQIVTESLSKYNRMIQVILKDENEVE